jgi:hypothetical protein
VPPGELVAALVVGACGAAVGGEPFVGAEEGADGWGEDGEDDGELRGGELVGVWGGWGVVWSEVEGWDGTGYKGRTISMLAHRVFTTLVEWVTRAERQMAAIMPSEPDARTAPMAIFLLDSV